MSNYSKRQTKLVIDCIESITPEVLAETIADISHYLADQSDGIDVISYQQWDKIHADMKIILWRLQDVAGEATDDFLMDAGAEPEIVYERILA